MAMTLPSSSNSRIWSKFVTCSKNMPKEYLAGVAAMRCRRSPSKVAMLARQTVAHAVDRKCQARIKTAR